MVAPRAVTEPERMHLDSGPERVEAGWWDGEEVRRDYYVTRAAHEAAWWVYREHGSGRWYVHGLFG